MKELDFDELDRAVNTLMGNVPQTTEPAKQDDVKVLTIASTLTDNTPPVMPVGEVRETVRVETVSTEPTVTPAAPAGERIVAPPAVRRGGRFMDVIHPAATTKKATPSQSVSRQGVTLAPLGAALSDEEPIAVETPVEESVPVHTDDTSMSDASESQAWPDPLDFSMSDTEEAPVIETSEVAVEDITPEEGALEPLSSPFIPDAKVEKRPLGAPAPEVVPDTPELASVVEDLQAESVVSEPAVVEAEPVMLPEELQGDLMAIESDASSSTAAVGEPAVATEITSPKDAEKTPDVSSAVSTAFEAAPPSVAVAAPALVGPVSIPQQYREEPSTGDVTNGSIYDTASYHQPLEHPAKKSTGWLWVIWVLVLLLLGAGGGALAYLYLLQ